MSNFEVCLNAVFPLIAMMLVGFVVRLTGLVNGKDVEKMNKVVFRVFLPVLVFKQVYNSDLANAIRPRLLLYAVLGVLAAFGLACITAKLLIRNRSQRSAVIQGIYRSNFAIIGIPIAQSLLNGADTGAVSVLLAVVVPMYNVLAVIILETYSDKHDSVGHVLLDVAKNPLILGSLCGIIFLIFGWKLPPLIESVVNSMSGVGSPMMLFLLGAFFEFRRLREHLYPLTVACVGRLVVMPAIFLLLGALLGFRGVEFAALIGIFASSNAVAAFTMTQQMGGDAGLAGDIVVVTSTLCPFTIFGWSFLFKSLGMF